MLRSSSTMVVVAVERQIGLHVPGRTRALMLLAVSLVLSMTTWFSASAVIPQLRGSWGLSDVAASWLTIAVQVGFVVGAVASSLFNLADMVVPQRVILAGTSGAALCNALIAATNGPKLAMLLRLATGFFLAGVYPPALKLMSTWFVKGRGTALGIMVGALTVGSAGPHLVNGLGGLDWQLVIYATSALTLLGGLVASCVGDGPHPFPKAVFDPRQLRMVFSNRGVRLASFGYFGHMWELYAMWAWFVVFFSDFLTSTGSPIGSAPAFATFAVIGIGGIGCYAGGVLGDRWGRTNTTVAMMAISGAAAVTIGLLFNAPSWLVLIVGLIWGFTVVADSAQFSTIVTELAHPAYVGTALTMQLAVGFTLTVATIWLIPILEGLLSWRWAFAFLAPGPALGIVAMLRLRSLPEAERIAGGRG